MNASGTEGVCDVSFQHPRQSFWCFCVCAVSTLVVNAILDTRPTNQHLTRPFPREDQYGDGRGQSYRPARSPPPHRNDSYRAPRSPAMRGPPFLDSYRAPQRGRSRSPPPFRPRSRSPRPFRPREAPDTYRGRAPRSPPRRDFGGREGGNYRPGGPPPRFRNEPGFAGRSPLRPPPRERSPLPLKRGRDISPAGSRGRRSPPPPNKRERLVSPARSRYNAYPPSREPSPPRGRGYSPPAVARRLTPPRGATRAYRPASRSPLRRNEHVDPRKIDWRRRSPSPPTKPKPDLIPADNSGAQSVTSSRRSSPPIHPSRLAVIEPEERSARPSPREDYLPSRPPFRTRSPLPSGPRSPIPLRARSPPVSRPRSPLMAMNRSPLATAPSPQRRRESPPPRGRDAPPTGPRVPPTRPTQQHEENQPAVRAPPTGPGGSRPHTSDMPIPTGPRPSAISPPTHPRGAAPGRGGGFQREFPPRADYPGTRGRGAPYANTPFRGRGGGPPPPAYGREQQDFSSGPPSGPRNSFSQAPPYRQGSISGSSTYPRSTRFAPNGAPVPSGPKAELAAPGGFNDRDRKPSNPYLTDSPRIVEGGQKAPELYNRSRLDKLEDEAERLRKAIEEKQTIKRKGLRDWERLERESETAAFRAQLVDDSVRALAGEGDGGAAF